MKLPFLMLGMISILLLLSGCASGDMSVRRDYRNSLPVPSSSLLQDHAESIQAANPKAPAYAIAQRRLGGPDKPSKKELKQRAARQEFRDDLAEVLGTP